MKILQINNFEAIGGGSDRVFQLTTRMLLDRGHDVATLACGSTPFDPRKQTWLLPRNGYIERNPFATLRNVRNFISRPDAAASIDDIVQRFGPDLVHLHIFYGQISSSILERIRFHRIPCVMTVHEYRMLCPVSTLFTETAGVCEKCAGGNYWHAVLNRCNRGSLAASVLSAVECAVRDRRFDYLKHIDHFFMVSEFCLRKHIEYRPGIASRSSVLYNFVDLPAAASVRAVETEPAAERSYLYVGRLSKEKGLGLLCREFASRPRGVLRIAGDGPLAAALRSEYRSCPNIQFLGKLGSPELKEQIERAWFTVAPSEWYENNPMSILESFALETPTIAARIGGIPELVIEGVTGLLFEPSNSTSLRQALDRADAMTESERTNIARQCRDMIANRHTIETHYKGLIAGYETAITSRR